MHKPPNRQRGTRRCFRCLDYFRFNRLHRYVYSLIHHRPALECSVSCAGGGFVIAGSRLHSAAAAFFASSAASASLLFVANATFFANATGFNGVNPSGIVCRGTFRALITLGGIFSGTSGTSSNACVSPGNTRNFLIMSLRSLFFGSIRSTALRIKNVGSRSIISFAVLVTKFPTYPVCR
eukprot:31539-Pelagococcus_subviridis.AAC.3